MVYLISQSYRRFYHANKCSCATLFCVLMWAATLVIPFFLAFSTNNFWLRKNEMTEQPIIHFRNEVVMYNLVAGTSYGYSSVSDLSELFENQIVSPTVKSLSIDKNQDGKPDFFEFQISFGYQSGQTNNDLQASQIYLFFDYGLRDRVKLQMQDFIKIDINPANGLSKAYIVGEIELKQRNPLQASTIIRNIYNTSLFDDANQNVNAVTLQEEKLYRNESLYCSCQSSIMGGSSGSISEITIKLAVPPEQRVIYIPTILENLKFSWIQYIALFIPIYLIISRTMTFAFRNKIFATQEINDLPSKKID